MPFITSRSSVDSLSLLHLAPSIAVSFLCVPRNQTSSSLRGTMNALDSIAICTEYAQEWMLSTQAINEHPMLPLLPGSRSLANERYWI